MYGGAISIEGEYIWEYNTNFTFVNNYALYKGGAIFMEDFGFNEVEGSVSVDW